jgi:hypothetical protein
MPRAKSQKVGRRCPQRAAFEQLTINWNDRATVQLTYHGLSLWERTYRRAGMVPPKLESRLLTEPLWSIALIFGPELFMGNDRKVFESMEIHVLHENA